MNKSKNKKISHPLVELTRARLLEFVRNPGTVFWVFVFPVLLAVVLGIAFRNRSPESSRIAVVGKNAEAVVNRLGDLEHLKIAVSSEQDAQANLRTAKIDLLLRVVPGKDHIPAATYRFDPMRAESLRARSLVDQALQRAYGRTDVVAIEDETVEEQGGRYIDFLLPGLIGLNIMSSCMWGLGYAVVDSRRRKLLKRFAATPMHRSHFLLSYILSRLAFLVAEVVALALFGYLVFDVHVSGAFIDLLIFAIIGAFSFSGISMLIAARPETTEVASGWMNFVMLPMWLVSGSFFAYSRFPEALHPFIRALPLTALNDGLRAVINEGVPLFASWIELSVLAAWGAISFVIALAIFRWQ